MLSRIIYDNEAARSIEIALEIYINMSLGKRIE